jgi:hypothetical protein
MKTAKQTNQHFPRPGRFSLYICAVAIMCFLNWVALVAQSVPSAKYDLSLWDTALAEEYEPDIQLQDWMMDFENGYAALSEEPEIEVEPWMLSFNTDYMVETGETEINFEPWMINFEQRCLIVDEESDIPVACWMVSTCTWCAASLIARK